MVSLKGTSGGCLWDPVTDALALLCIPELCAPVHPITSFAVRPLSISRTGHRVNIAPDLFTGFNCWFNAIFCRMCYDRVMKGCKLTR